MDRKLSALILLLSFLVVSTADAEDWPQWGGPQRDIVWRETGIVEKLPAELPRVWSAPIAEGYAGPAVADGRVFVTDRLAKENLERVHAFDASTGDPLWSHKYDAPYSISYPAGPRATPTVDGNRVYTLGAVGHLFCFDVKSGDIVWGKHCVEDYGTKLPTWGMAGAPLVDGDQLIVLVGGADGALVVSFNKHTGEELWRALDDPDVGYCAPVILEFGGRRQLIIWHASHVSSLDPATGALLWQHPFPVRYALCVPTPRKLGNRLFLTAFYEGPLMLDLGENGLTPKELWRTDPSNNDLKNNSLHSIMPTSIVTEKFIYGMSSYGQLRCVRTDTGEQVWETLKATGKGRWWNAFLIPHGKMSGERVYLANEQGELIQARLTGAGYEEIARAHLIKPTRKVQRRMTIWSHPAFAMKSVFARNDEELVRVDLAE
ncbi:outer membrane biogenesis protein BamB [Adhaeretor mobilis]|uniref:Outer membrane biogenesis protein BamB n=2 Tax=Adhaeretor mobilis TaxID=1930276 RepID=A0A517MQG5_9BACT|nr:outer membrane biogenesis protein BamB [Adhaeretor mobilis]